MFKVKNISGQVRGTQGKKRKLVMKLAHQLLRMKKDSYPPKLKVKTNDHYYFIIMRLKNLFYNCMELKVDDLKYIKKLFKNLNKQQKKFISLRFI